MPLYRYSWVKKTAHPTVAYNFAKCWPMSKILSLWDYFVTRLMRSPCNEMIIKDPTTPQTHRYITLWNVNVRKLATILTHYAIWGPAGTSNARARALTPLISWSRRWYWGASDYHSASLITASVNGHISPAVWQISHQTSAANFKAAIIRATRYTAHIERSLLLHITNMHTSMMHSNNKDNVIWK